GAALAPVAADRADRRDVFRSVDEEAAMNKIAEWKCPACHESNPANFELCWNCGTDQQGVDDPNFKPAIAFHPVCDMCGYLLVGLSTNRCPECGHPFDPEKKDTPRKL